MKWMITVAASVAIVAGSVAPMVAADLQTMPRKRVVQRATIIHESWRDRCARAQHYCLYAYRGYVYHYPWHDPLLNYASARRYRRY